MAGGYALEIVAHVLTGDGEGPTLGIFSGSHGDEIFSVELLRQIGLRLPAKPFRGRVVLVPVMNPPAYAASTRNTPVDGNNMNRVFPGSAGGWLTEKMTHVISREILPHLQAIIDFHPGAVDTGIYYCYSQPPTTPYKQAVNDMARLANTPVIHETRPHPGSLCEYAETLGVPAVLPEIGGSFAHEGPWLEAAVQGVWNVMTYRGMMPGPYVLPAEQIVVAEDRFLRIGQGGLFFPEVGFDRMGTTVPEGTVLGRVLSPYTFEELEVIRAPFPSTALMLMRGRFSRVEPGDYGYIVGRDTGRRVSGFA